MNKTIRFLTCLLVCVVISSASNSEERKCSQEIVIKNKFNANGFGILTKKYEDGEPVTIAPRAIAIDQNSDIYIGDSVNYRLVKFDSKGNYILEFKLQPPMKKAKPAVSYVIRDIRLDNNNNVYVWNSFEERVEIYDMRGRFKEFVESRDKLKTLLVNLPKRTAPKGKYANYIYNFTSYTPNKALPGAVFYSISVIDPTDKNGRILTQCSNVQIDSDTDGLIYSLDYNGNVYTFDGYSNVVRINPYR